MHQKVTNRRTAILGMLTLTTSLTLAPALMHGAAVLADERGDERKTNEKKHEESHKKEEKSEERRKEKTKASEKREKKRKSNEKAIEAMNIDDETKQKLHYCSRIKHTKSAIADCLESKGVSLKTAFPDGLPLN